MLKANFILLIFYLLFNAGHGVAKSNTSVNEIPSIQSRTSSSTALNHTSYFYTKFQDVRLFAVAAVSTGFVRVPGLTVIFHHNRPMLYRIGFQGGCQSGTTAYNFVHLLIDGRVLIENELLPNNHLRQAVAPHLGKTIDEVDSRSGGVFMGMNVPFVTSCPRFRKVVLPSGIHSVDVGIRITWPSMNIIGGQLDVELSSYDTAVHVGLSYPTVR